MKAFSIATILVLLAATMWFGVKNAETRRELEAVRDTLYSLKIQQPYLFDGHNKGVLEKVGELYLDINDTIIEAHRITIKYGRNCALLRLEVKSDSSVYAVFKKFTYKNPLTGEGEDSLYVVSNPEIDLIALQQFKVKLTEIEFPAAVGNNDILCCLGGGTLSWEAVMHPSVRYRFSTFCGQSLQFSEACEFLLRQMGDEYFKQIL